MDLAIKLIVLLPLLAAAIAGLFCRVIGDRPAQIVTCAALLIAAALSVFVFVRIGFGPEQAKLVVVRLFTWIDSGNLEIAWALRVDTLTAVMLIVVTGVSSMVHVYSVGYMAEDPSIPINPEHKMTVGQVKAEIEAMVRKLTTKKNIEFFISTRVH